MSPLRTLLVGAALLASAPAWAVYECGGQVDTCQCGANNPYPCCDNGGNCTWWAWEAACCKWGVGLPGWGNANQWVGNANGNASYEVLGHPVTDAVSCRTLGAYGHVAFVTSVSGANISVTEENCWGNYGMRAANYSSSFFQGYITRKGQTECAPGDSQTEACGNCGTHARGCGSNGKWGSWGACGAQGACTPGTTDTAACGECGTHARTCGGSCQWGAFAQTCEGPDPDGGTLACDTGQPGACGPGTLRCVDGGVACAATTAASPEACDGVDNDCNGTVDDGLVCNVGLAPAGPGVGGSDPSAAPAAAAASAAVGTCSSTAAGLPAGLAMLLWFAAFRRRRASALAPD